jgi:hypothetical protein
MHAEIKMLAARMEAELKANEHKGDWRDRWSDRDRIFFELAWHQSKLMMAVHASDREKIAEHTADMCNLYLMLVMMSGVFTVRKEQSFSGGGFGYSY